MDHFCYLCFVFVMLSCLFIAALWLPLGSLVCDVYLLLSLSQVVSLVRCGTWLYRFLIFAFLLTYILLSPYHCFIYFLYLDLYLIGDDTSISKGSFMRTKHIFVFIHI